MKNRKLIIMIVLGIIIMTVLTIALKNTIGKTNISFEQVKEAKVPHKIQSEILPEYRTLERAMACIIDNKVYVIVTRGEKPTAGFEVKISKLVLEGKNNKTNLIVYADFADPENSENMAQVISFPNNVVKANIGGLPDTIELRAQYIT